MTTGELKMEGTSTNPALEDACDDLIDIRLKYEDLEMKESVVISRILEALRKEGRSSLKFKGYEFNVIAPNLQLSVRVIK